MKPPLPLFDWRRSAEADRLWREREELSKRIQTLRPRSHKRLELEFRLRDLTNRLIAVESGIHSKGGSDEPVA